MVHEVVGIYTRKYNVITPEKEHEAFLFLYLPLLIDSWTHMAIGALGFDDKATTGTLYEDETSIPYPRIIYLAFSHLASYSFKR